MDELPFCTSHLIVLITTGNLSGCLQAMNNWNIIRWWVYTLYVSIYCIDLKVGFLFTSFMMKCAKCVTFSLSLPFFSVHLQRLTDSCCCCCACFHVARCVFGGEDACEGLVLRWLCPDVLFFTKSAADVPFAQIKEGFATECPQRKNTARLSGEGGTLWYL